MICASTQGTNLPSSIDNYKKCREKPWLKDSVPKMQINNRAVCNATVSAEVSSFLHVIRRYAYNFTGCLTYSFIMKPKKAGASIEAPGVKLLLIILNVGNC